MWNNRLSPYEWENSFPCITDPDKLQNQFSLKNSFWFTIGSIMQQGSDLTPKLAHTIENMRGINTFPRQMVHLGSLPMCV